MPTLLIIIEFQTFDEKVNNLYILLYTKTFLSIYDYVTLYSLSAQKNMTLSKCTYYTGTYIVQNVKLHINAFVLLIIVLL